MRKAASVGFFSLPLTISIAGMISVGGYDWVDTSFTHGFIPSLKKKIADVWIWFLTKRGEKSFGFSKNVSLYDVVQGVNSKVTMEELLSRIQEDGYKVAPIDALLGVGILRPQQQIVCPIVSLDCLWHRHKDGSSYVPALTKARGGGRAFRMQCWDQLPATFSVVVAR